DARGLELLDLVEALPFGDGLERAVEGEARERELAGRELGLDLRLGQPSRRRRLVARDLTQVGVAPLAALDRRAVRALPRGPRAGDGADGGAGNGGACKPAGRLARA